jgi:hypothetical protein
VRTYEPSFVVPGFPNVEGGCLLQLIAHALYVGRQVPLRGAEERNAEAEATRRCVAVEEAEYVRLLEEDLGKARAAHRRAEVMLARLLIMYMRKAEAAHRRAMEQEERHRAEQETHGESAL